MQVSNLNGVKNQFVVNADNGDVLFQSYNSIIVRIDRKNNKTYLDQKYYNYSKTTSKHRNMFLNETSKEIEAKIKSGEYILVNLN